MGKKYIDNKLSKENNKENKTPKSDTIPQTFDIASIKKNIMDEMYNINSNYLESITNSLPLSNSIIIDENNQNIEYLNQYQVYLTEEFNSRCVYLIISFINQSKDFPEEYRTKQDFPKILISVIKSLMMNEFEISIYTLYIDKYGWKSSKINFKEYFIYLGLYTKQLTMSKDNFKILIQKFDNEISKSLVNFEDWKKEISPYVPTVIEINERFKLLNNPTNSFCKKNFIDFNGIVDKIVKLSQSYSDNKNQNNKVRVREESVLDGLENSFKNNLSNSNNFFNNSLNKKNNYPSENRFINFDVSTIPNINSNLRNQKEISNILPKQESNNLLPYRISILSNNSRISDDYDNSEFILNKNFSLLKNNSFMDQPSQLYNKEESNQFLESLQRNNFLDVNNFPKNSNLRSSQIFPEINEEITKQNDNVKKKERKNK